MPHEMAKARDTLNQTKEPVRFWTRWIINIANNTFEKK
uniref:Uncharacterized protein n=1 Tax=Anguilla anguilla TaxID=7936 RepID=A0A0E9W176_ANGAN